MKVLIVEDDFTSRLLLQKLLAPYGESHIAVNGKEAVEAFSQELTSGESYDLVCLDIMMPDMDGQQALKAIRTVEESKGIISSCGAKILMTTALADKANIMEALRGKCDYFLVKPIEKAKLLEQLRKLKLIS